MSQQTKEVAYTQDATVQRNRWWILTAIGMFTFMSTLDGSIVNIAMPVISKDLAVPTNQTTWVVSIYLIVICALLLLFGKIGDSFGKIKVFKIGTVLFTLGSLLSGFTHNLWALLGARVIQGIGAGMTMSTNNGIVTEVFPSTERGKALGLIGSFISLGSITGPGVGGIILAHLPWAYIFWMNVPVGILTIILGIVVLPDDRTMSGIKIDVNGFWTSALGIILLFAGVFIGQEIGFTQPLILGFWVAAIILFVAFWRIEHRIKNPLLSFHIFRNLNFSISLLTALIIFVTNFFFTMTMPFYLENARGLAPNFAGYVFMIFPIVQVLISPLAGSIADKHGSYPLMTLGLLLLVLAQLGYTMVNINSPIWTIMGLVAIVGIGNGVFQAPNNSLVMSSVGKEDLGIAGGVNSTAREMGMVVGIALSTTVLFQAMSYRAGRHVSTYVNGQPEIFMFGMRVVFALAALLCLVALILTIDRWWKSRKVNLLKAVK